ncbi:hypothetical protein BC829DRAFT_302760 [Chytridium lagenaria]|nr:hypothetical protein BC829DRAFT_302760 [Chytridium lagenaria]
MSKASVKKCISAYAHSTWRGMKLKIEEAKPDYRERLQKEREDHASTSTEVQAREQPRLDRKRKRSLAVGLPFAACAQEKLDTVKQDVVTTAVLERVVIAPGTGRIGKGVWWRKMRAGKIAPVLKITLMRKGKKRTVVVDPLKFRLNHKRFEDYQPSAIDAKRHNLPRNLPEPSLLDVWRKLGMESFDAGVEYSKAADKEHPELKKPKTSSTQTRNNEDSQDPEVKQLLQPAHKPADPVKAKVQRELKKNMHLRKSADEDDDSDDENLYRSTSRHPHGMMKTQKGSDKLWTNLAGADEEDDRTYAEKIKSIGDDTVSKLGR